MGCEVAWRPRGGQEQVTVREAAMTIPPSSALLSLIKVVPELKS